MMLSLLLALGGLEEAQHIVLPEACQRPWPWVREGERSRLGRGGCPPASTLTHSCSQAHFTLFIFTPFLCHSFLPDQTRKDKCPSPLSLPHFLLSLYYFPSQALSLGLLQSLLTLSFSSFPRSLPPPVSTFPAMTDSSTALPLPH